MKLPSRFRRRRRYRENTKNGLLRPMSLTISTNVVSLLAQRRAAAAGADMSRTIERLSSGVRIKSGADDAAGMAIAERMSSGLRGNAEANRNINEATSLLQTADHAMAQVTEALQRLRTLAVQSGSSVLSGADHASLKEEANQILAHINKLGEDTEYNGQAVFSQDRASIGGDKAKRAVLDNLRNGWLTQAESMVKQYYGISADGASMTVNLDGFTDGQWNVLASVSGTVSPGSGKFNNIHLNIDMADFTATNQPDGGTAPMYSDRVIAHEMVHAIMSRATGFQLPQWFVEGTAELIHGADERLRNAVAAPGGLAAVVNSVSGTFSYEGAYAASRYMHAKLNEMGVEGGMKGIMMYLNAHQDEGLDEALNAVTAGQYADTAAFVSDFTANGAAYITNDMDLNNADTGAIGGLDADKGPVKTAKSVVSGTSSRAWNDPLEGFKEIFPTSTSTTGMREVQVQLGANAGDTITLSLAAMNAFALGLDDLNLQSSAIALAHIDEAIDFVARQRVVVGASGKRLEVAANAVAINTEALTASRARIVDTDYAAETVALTRSQILQQAANAMVAQANNQPRNVLALLR